MGPMPQVAEVGRASKPPDVVHATIIEFVESFAQQLDFRILNGCWSRVSMFKQVVSAQTQTIEAGTKHAREFFGNYRWLPFQILSTSSFRSSTLL